MTGQRHQFHFNEAKVSRISQEIYAGNYIVLQLNVVINIGDYI